VSDRFSPLSAPFPLRDLPLRASLPLHRFLPHPLHALPPDFRPAPLTCSGYNGPLLTRNSSADEIANMNFLYDDVVLVQQNTIQNNRFMHKFSHRSTRLCVGTHVYQIQWTNAM